MNHLQSITHNYLDFCKFQKRLDEKTLKAYRIDLNQFINRISVDSFSLITPEILEAFIATLHTTYKPKTAKRKIASVKAFFHYLEYKNLIETNLFIKYRLSSVSLSHSPKRFHYIRSKLCYLLCIIRKHWRGQKRRKNIFFAILLRLNFFFLPG